MNEIDFAEDGTSMSFKNDIPFTMPAPCNYSGKIPANTTISLTPRNDWGGGFGANGFMKGWGHAIDINVPITLLDGSGNPTSSQLAEGSISSAVSVTSGRNLMPKLAEWHIYGNGEQGRFAIKKPDQGDIYYLDPPHTDFVNKKFSRILSYKEYEIKDHLGNVRVAITDYKLPQNPDPTAQPRGVMPFIVDEKAVNDYYPYGMLIAERSWSSSDYRYGYNTQEKSLEINPHGNHTTAEFWEYDARSVKRWNPDPVVYPDLSPFQTYRGNPILFSDPYGDDVISDIGDFFFGSNGKEASPIDPGKPASEGLFSKIFGTLSVIGQGARSGGYVNAKAGGYTPPGGESIGDINRFYNRAHRDAFNKKINTKWFAMSAQVTSFLDVGLLDFNTSMLDAIDPFDFVLSKETNDFLYRIAYKIKNFNMDLVSEMKKSGTMNGIKPQGYETDIKLLTSEQLIIQNEIKALGDNKAKTVLRDYNDAFSQIIKIRGENNYLNIANRILGGKIDFGNYEHRLVIGIVGLRLQYNKSTDKASVLKDLNKLLKR